MTDYATNLCISPVTATKVMSKKGDILNRANCAAEQVTNSFKSLAADAIVISGTVAGIKAASKGGKFAGILSDITDLTANSLRKLFGCGKLKNDYLYRTFGKLKKLSPKIKAIGLAGTLGIGALLYMVGKHNYKKGRIDQKYIDKALLSQHTGRILAQ